MSLDSLPSFTDAELKKRRKQLSNLCERVKFQYSIRNIKTWADVYTFTSVPANVTPEHLKTEVKFSELKEFLTKLINEFEQQTREAKRAAIIAPVVTKTSEVPSQETTKVSSVTDNTQHVSINKISSEETSEAISSSNNYGLKPSPNEKAFLYWFQKKAVAELLDGILVRKYRSMLLLSPTGTGKTYMVGAFIRRLVDQNFHYGKTMGIVNYLYVTRASIVEQTKRVFENTFNLRIKDGVEVLNIEQLRSRAGQLWVTEKSEIVNGEEQFYWEWKKFMNPVVIIWDECQALKNTGSTQSKIAAALNNVDGVVQVHVSATPFTRVCEAKCFAVSTHKDISEVYGISGAVLTNATWPTYASNISGSQKAADDYNEAAVERLIKDLEPYIVRVKGVRPQFDAINDIRLIEFRNDTERTFYHDALKRYEEKKAKLAKKKEEGDAEAGIEMLVAFLMFRMAAEICRAEYIGDEMFRTVTVDKKAAVCAYNFKGSLIKSVMYLIEKKGVPRSQISLIWGGGQTQLNKKQKAKASIKAQADKLAAAGMNTDELLETLDLDEVEDRELQDIPEEYKLGAQSKEERQREIDRFQSGKSLYCFFTFRAGGVGLSLHHSDELSPVKVGHKESGYAIEEDIPKVPIRERRLFAAPTYSAIEIVQGLGRCPRLTSLSNTEQFLIFYNGTIENDVARIVSKKLRCLSKVVKTREKWSDIITDGRAKVTDHLIDLPDDVEGDNPLEGESTTDEGE